MLIRPSLDASVHPRERLLRQVLDGFVNAEALARRESNCGGQISQGLRGPLNNQHPREFAELLLGFGFEADDLSGLVIVL